MSTSRGRAAYDRKKREQRVARGAPESHTGAGLVAEQEQYWKEQKRMNQGSLPEARRLGDDTDSVEVATALHVNTQAGKKLIGALLSTDKHYSWKEWKELMEPLTVKALERILYVDADYWKGDMTPKERKEHKKREDTFNKFHEAIEIIDKAIDTSRIQTLRKILSTMGGRKVSSKPWYQLIW